MVNKPLATCMLSHNCLTFQEKNSGDFLASLEVFGQQHFAWLGLAVDFILLFGREKVGKKELPASPKSLFSPRQLQHVSLLVQVSPGSVSLFFLEDLLSPLCRKQSLNSFWRGKVGMKKRRGKKKIRETKHYHIPCSCQNLAGVVTITHLTLVSFKSFTSWDLVGRS